MNISILIHSSTIIYFWLFAIILLMEGGPEEENIKLTSKEIKSLQNMFDQNDISSYFKGFNAPTITSQLTSSQYSQNILGRVEGMIQKGQLQVGSQEYPVEKLINKIELGDEQKRIMEMKSKRQFIEQQLQELRNQTSGNAAKEASGSQKGIIFSRQEHKNLIKKLKKERDQRDSHHRQMLERLQEKSRQKEQAAIRASSEKHKQELQVRREMIEQTLARKREQHERFVKQQTQGDQKMKKIKEHKFVYQQMEERFQNDFVFRNLQEKKKKLKQLRQYKALNIEQVKNHEKTYLQRKKLEESRQSKKIPNWNYQPPQKSERLASILQEQRLSKILQLQQKKKFLDEKLTKKEEYIAYLKQNFAPKIDPLKQQQIEKRLAKQKKEKIQPIDHNQIGLNYLEQAKKRRKKHQSLPRPQTERNPHNSHPQQATQFSALNTSNESKGRALTNYLTVDYGQNFEKRRRAKLSRLASDSSVEQQIRLKELKSQSERLGERMIRKQRELKYKKDPNLKEEALELLLSSIQAKIGIIKMCS